MLIVEKGHIKISFTILSIKKIVTVYIICLLGFFLYNQNGIYYIIETI